LGFFTAVTNTVSKEAMEKAVLSSIPKGTEEINRKAFEIGYEYGMKLLASRGEQRAASGAGSPRKRKAAAKE
ncbi:MAG: hypothetical protein ONB06_10475, partial [candidate division KSB1 bacterium]|nr:hypothetical protein [candidate division KSB1 bacterium]